MLLKYDSNISQRFCNIANLRWNISAMLLQYFCAVRDVTRHGDPQGEMIGRIDIKLVSILTVERRSNLTSTSMFKCSNFDAIWMSISTSIKHLINDINILIRLMHSVLYINSTRNDLSNQYRNDFDIKLMSIWYRNNFDIKLMSIWHRFHYHFPRIV